MELNIVFLGGPYYPKQAIKTLHAKLEICIFFPNEWLLQIALRGYFVAN